MNRLQRLLHRHTIGELDKLAYIEGIHAQHSMLFDYISFMENSDVADIRIQPSGIAVTSRSQQVAMYLDPDDQHLVPYTLLNFGSYETVETEFLKTVAQPGWSVLDIGANCGWYSLVLARKSPEITVHAFEPIPSTCLLLQRNIKLNDLNNVRVHEIGISDKPGTLDFLYTRSCSGATSLKQAGQPGMTERVRCDVTTIDDFCHARNISPQLLKCDIEGAELLALKGGERTIGDAKPIILLELLRKWSTRFGYHPNDAFALLDGMGYDAYTVGFGVLHACPEVTEDTVETNFIFLHRDAHRGVIDAWRPSI